ncbi:CGNR zinc finger [Mycobacteroides salmoniphilum]|uniref:CGNR zinc finger n=1 Tax=Mycobacteroides salmoniphilum TaxID=404941 RepID=A0A4R8S194_9MYCO|nr:CGNR zinc finger domain-containing protein [Mycobacteroides salmoniphilum]TDZ76565.1 CGNR zinc finger [Mycobacteroides salmoniphilum]TDZ78550.1 CGNR zinc finger [Mycobacteroides salmoniphilum]TDZ85083.1 CGNR zinc finger [Mycobacteroides salmoniphilum]
METSTSGTIAAILGEPLPVELMNTVRGGRGEVRDALDGDEPVYAWLNAMADRILAESGAHTIAFSLEDAQFVAGDLRALRDALRCLAAEVTEDPRPPTSGMTHTQAVATINTLARARAELVWPVDGEPSRAATARGSQARLTVGLIARQAVDFFGGLERHQLRACLASHCVLYFVKEHPRREWCTPKCGNRARVKRHYDRQTVAGP